MKQVVQSVLKKLGYRLSSLDDGRQAYALECFFALMKRRGFTPKHVIDVGANKGTWTRAAIGFFPDAYYSLVEPQVALKIYEQDIIEAGYKIRWINAGAGDRSGSLPFAVSS